MSIPAFDDHGLLPVGVHDATLAEIESRFCWNAHRQALWRDFLAFWTDHVTKLSPAVRVWIDGSFSRSKPCPSDVDVVLDCTDATQETFAQVMIVWLNRVEMKTRYHVDVWPRHPTITNDLSRYFQYIGEKAAAELTLDPKHPKGIVKVQP